MYQFEDDQDDDVMEDNILSNKGPKLATKDNIEEDADPPMTLNVMSMLHNNTQNEIAD